MSLLTNTHRYMFSKRRNLKFQKMLQLLSLRKA